MPKASDITLDNHKWGVLLYGPQGVGKTHFLRTVPRPLFILDFDGGISTLKGEEEIDYIQPTARNWRAYESFYDNFIVHNRPAPFEGETFKLDDYATIAYDSLTSMLALVMSQIAEVIQMKDRIKLGKHKGSHRADYNLAQNILGDFVRDLQQTKKNFFLTSHERIDRDEGSQTIIRIGPSISPSAYNAIATPIDEIWRLDSVAAAGGKRKRVMFTSQEGVWTGKARMLSPDAGRVENPTFDKITSLVK